MMRSLLFFAFALLLAGSCVAADLVSYVQNRDSSFKWEISDTHTLSQRCYVLKMTSQTWQGIPWTNEIEIYRPAKCKYPKTVFLYDNIGKSGETLSYVMAELAEKVRCPVAIVFGVPNEPLFGQSEEELINYTLTKAAETGDNTWPLLFPMAKSVTSAMDAIQQFSRQQLKEEITGFVISGASKRGWTAWLAAAADPDRVKGLVGIVYGNINLATQLGAREGMGSGYYLLGPNGQGPETETWKRLNALMDPWTYRDRLTMPKLIVNATNDGFWQTNWLDYCLPELPGTNFVLNLPNADHNMGGGTDLSGLIKLVPTMAAFTRAIASGSKLPNVSWKYTDSGNSCLLRITTNLKGATGRLWAARSETRDFRTSPWEWTPMKATKTGFSGTTALPAKGFVAVFGDITSPDCATLSTQVHIVGGTLVP